MNWQRRQCLPVRSCHIRKWIMLTYGWKQRWTGLRCNAMKNHALQQRRGAGAVPLSPSWQVCSVTWQLSISMINAVVLGLPVTKLKSVLLWYFKVKRMSRSTQTLKDNLGFIPHIEMFKVINICSHASASAMPFNDTLITTHEAEIFIDKTIFVNPFWVYQTKCTTLTGCSPYFIPAHLWLILMQWLRSGKRAGASRVMLFSFSGRTIKHYLK